MGDPGRLACDECRALAEANGDEADCADCPNAQPLAGMSPQNMDAFDCWRLLDVFGRGLDGFSGAPLPLRMESVDAECGRTADPDGIRWRICAIEQKIYAMRVERFKERNERKPKAD